MKNYLRKTSENNDGRGRVEYKIYDEGDESVDVANSSYGSLIIAGHDDAPCLQLPSGLRSHWTIKCKDVVFDKFLEGLQSLGLTSKVDQEFVEIDDHTAMHAIAKSAGLDMAVFRAGYGEEEPLQSNINAGPR